MGAINETTRPAGAAATVQLLELGAHFALAERAARIGYWRHQIDEDMPHWSPGFFAMLGIDPNTVRPSSDYLVKRIHPDDRVVVATQITGAITEGKPFYYRTRSWNTNEPERFYDTHGDVERDATGRVVALLGVVREVTAEVAAENKLREREAAYRFMTEEAIDMISRHGPDGTTTFVSPAVRHVLGYEPERYVGRSPLEDGHPDDFEHVRVAIAKARKTGSPTTYSHRLRHRDGHYIWAETRLRFVTNPATGEHLGAISVTRDITARKRFEEELGAARERAEQANHVKSRFLANMSHELRTPLNAIIGFSDILAREMFGPVGNAQYAEYAKLINESGSMLLELINDILDMSKIEAGKFELRLEDILVRESVDAGVRMISRLAEQKQIEIGVRIEPQTLTLPADQRALKQILLNLLSNAVKFTDVGGRVDVEATAANGTVALVVRDTGVGIPKSALPRLAQPFEQASNDPARTHGGSGLGLALVKSLTQLHGGTLTITSEEGRGTQVTVTLPLEAAADRAA